MEEHRRVGQEGATRGPLGDSDPDGGTAPGEPDAAPTKPEPPLLAPWSLPPLPASPLADGLAIRRGLAIWLPLILVGGMAGLLFGLQELALLLVLAGLFVAAQAADADQSLEWLYYAVTWVVPVGGAITFFLLPAAVLQSDVGGLRRMWAIGASVGAGLISLLTIARPVSNALVPVLFRGAAPTHTLRLTARIVLLCFLFAIPAMLFFHQYLWDLIDSGVELFDRASLSGGLLGYVALAFAGVGLLVRRDFRSALERLGVRPFTKIDVVMVPLGVVAIFGLNAGADWIQHMFLPDLWDMDHRVNERLAAGIGAWQIVLLGLSAGIGEEITLRGALQPRLGLVLTALLFATLHIQYTWFGVMVVFLLGMMLGLIRRQTSTSVAIAVHILYDVLAVITT